MRGFANSSTDLCALGCASAAGGGGGGLAGPPLLLWSPLPRRQRRRKSFLGISPLARKARRKICLKQRKGRGGGVRGGGGTPGPVVVSHSNTSLAMPSLIVSGTDTCATGHGTRDGGASAGRRSTCPWQCGHLRVGLVLVCTGGGMPRPPPPPPRVGPLSHGNPTCPQAHCR